MKKTRKICDEILTRFGGGEYLRYICTGEGEYPDQATFWRWRQKDSELAQRFMLALTQNVTALLERSELLIEEASTRDEILRGQMRCWLTIVGRQRSWSHRCRRRTSLWSRCKVLWGHTAFGGPKMQWLCLNRNLRRVQIAPKLETRDSKSRAKKS